MSQFLQLVYISSTFDGISKNPVFQFRNSQPATSPDFTTHFIEHVY